jgi:hypothetical protein
MRSLTRYMAAIIRTLLCIHPIVLHCRMAASTMGTPVFPEWYPHKQIARSGCARGCIPCFHRSKWSSFTSHFTFENFLHAAVSSRIRRAARARSLLVRAAHRYPARVSASALKL